MTTEENPPLSDNERLRRIGLLCCHCIRNLAYYREGANKKPRQNTQFWVTVGGNFIDIAVLEWCKLFVEWKGSHHWRQITDDEKVFQENLFKHLGMDGSAFAAYVDEVKTYRDKFIAHLDDERVMNIPKMDIAIQSIFFLYNFVITHNKLENKAKLPPDIAKYFDVCRGEAGGIYTQL